MRLRLSHLGDPMLFVLLYYLLSTFFVTISLSRSGKGTITVPTGALNNGQWHFVEITRNGRRVKVNVDRRVAGKDRLLVMSCSCVHLQLSHSIGNRQ